MPSTLAMEAQLAVVAADQCGVFTRTQATTAGFGAPQIERRVRAGVWRRVLPGVYRHATTPVSRPLAQWAAVLWAGPVCAVSHTSAAALWGLGCAPPERVELIVPKVHAPRSPAVTVHRVAQIGGADVVYARGLPVTTPVRTIIDLAAVLGDHDLRSAVDRARSRRLLTVRSVRVRLDEIGAAGRPGVRRLRAVLEASGSGDLDPSARMAG